MKLEGGGVTETRGSKGLKLKFLVLLQGQEEVSLDQIRV
jgi:hypothetical protein